MNIVQEVVRDVAGPAGSRSAVHAAAPPARPARSSPAGPAAATSAMSCRGWRNRPAFTGTGLAQPNMNATCPMVSELR